MRHLLLVVSIGMAACTGSIVGGPGDNPDDDSADDGVGPGPDEPIPPQDPEYLTAHPRIYLETNRERLAASLDSGVPAATRFRSMVDGQLDGADYYDFSSYFAALMGQLTGEPQYCAYAVSTSDAYVASEEALIAGGSRAAVSGDSYLEVGPRIGDLMLTYDWCYDSLTASQRTRWLALAAQAVWNVWHPDEATWGGHAFPWSGWATHDPSDNYYYSFLRATMMFGLAAHDEHPDAAGWLEFFRVTKFEGELVPIFEADLQGGGSREGTGYGVSMQGLWTLYDFWQSSTGEDVARQTTHTRASLLFEMHAIVPTRDRIAPTGDHARDSTATLFDYHRNFIQELAYLFRDDALAPRAKWFIDHSSVPEMDQGFMEIYDFLYAQPALAPVPVDGMGTAYYAPGAGETFARSSWDEDATWINLVAGPYTQSHAHHDQGHLMIFKGDWLAYDANVESHSGINQGEENHNLVRIVRGGSTVLQHVDTESQVLAMHEGAGWFHVAADLTPAYGGDSAVSDDEREVVFLEPDVVVVFDRVTTASDAGQIWQLNAPTSPAISGATARFTTGGHDLTVQRLSPTTATAAVHGWADGSEYGGGFRLDETSAGGAVQHLHVLSIDGAVQGAARSDADGRTGVTITFADGHTATVRFGTAGVDGTLEIQGQPLVNLDLGVDPLEP
jgi:hypothetical protein